MLMVTLLEGGTEVDCGFSVDNCSGVCGVFRVSSTAIAASAAAEWWSRKLGESFRDRMVSVEELRESGREVRCLFLEPLSSSPKGFGRVEGSEEAARSLVSGDIDAESIGLIEVGFAPQVPELNGPWLHTVAQGGYISASQS
jgi:hypothetical protein